MAVTELDTFIKKFNQLWQAGLTAHLDLDTHAGSAWVGLRVQLGHVSPGPLHHQAHQQHQAFRRVSPSRERRRARRLAARNENPITPAAAEEATEQEHSEEECVEKEKLTGQSNIAEEANNPVGNNENNGTNVEHAAEEAELAEAGKDKDLFECQICDFSSTWKNGLDIHMGRKHGNIEQLDGNDDELDNDKRYDSTEHYWKKGRIGMAYHSFLDANHLIDCTDLPKDEKDKEKEKLLDSRKDAFGKSFENYPPWKK